MLITLFTPTYNRAAYLSILYNSLLFQTYSDFEWIIVDDGSTDHTEELIHSFIAEKKIKISYVKQKNSGKHIAMNWGAQLAKGALFFVVDSDDHLPFNSLERVIFHWDQVQKLPSNQKNKIIGLAGNITLPSGEIVGGDPQYDVLDTDLILYRFQKNINGDKKEVYLTKVIQDNPFPKIENETFCPEALIFYRLADQGNQLRFFNESIYCCDYLEGGLTLDGLKTIKRGPISSLQSYADVIGFSAVPFLTRIKYTILFWRFSFLSKKQSFLEQVRILPHVGYVFFYPFGLLFHIRDIIKN